MCVFVGAGGGRGRGESEVMSALPRRVLAYCTSLTTDVITTTTWA